MLKKIALGVLVVVLALLVAAATRPAHFHVERSAHVAAPPEVVFPLINDFHQWSRWSPWEKLDPAMKREYSGAAQGQGAVYDWSGNDDVGVGRMSITDSKLPSRVAITLEFIEPWQATNQAVFGVVPDAGGSKVTWGMDGDNNFMLKAVSMFMNMDEMVGKDFESGLTNLQRVAEAESAQGAAQAPPQ